MAGSLCRAASAVIRSRCTTASALAVTIMPPFGPSAKLVTPRSISPASRTWTGVNSTPSGGATDWMTANCPTPEAMAGSRSTAARVTLGATCLSNSSHFALMPYSKWVKPVALPPGRARLLTKPAPTGSVTWTKTIGTVRVASSIDPMPEPPETRMTSGASATSSAAYWRKRPGSPSPQRVSIRMLRPSIRPRSCKAWTNAPTRPRDSGSSATDTSTPMRRIGSDCCGRAGSGHAAAAPPSKVMNRRRFISGPHV